MKSMKSSGFFITAELWWFFDCYRHHGCSVINERFL